MISFTQAVSASSNTVAIAAANPGDLILVFTYNALSATLPTLPSGFTNVLAGANATTSARLAYKFATGGETSAGTWTSASHIVCHVYSGVGLLGATPTLNIGNTATLNYLALSPLLDTGGTSWVACFGGAAAATAGMDGAPATLVNRTFQQKVNGLDTGGTVTSFALRQLIVTGSGRWTTVRIELRIPRFDATDAPTTSESAVASVTHSVSCTATDAPVISESADASVVPAGGASVSRTATDALSTSDTPTRILVTNRSATDALTTGESAAGGTGVAALGHMITSDAGVWGTPVGADLPFYVYSVAPEATRIVNLKRTTSEALTTSEAAFPSQAGHVNQIAADALAISESANRIAVLLRVATDAVATAEVATASRALQSPTRTATDALATAEAVTATRGAVSITRTATDALSIAQSVTGVRSTASVTRTASEALSTAEGITKSATQSRTATDAPVIAEVASKTAAQSRSTTDALSIASTATAIRTGAGVFARSTVESLATSEAIGRILVTKRTATDAPTTAELATGVRLTASVTRTTSESLTTADIASRKWTGLRSGAEVISTSETVTASKFGVVTRTATDSLTVSEVNARVLVAGRTTSESLAAVLAANRRWVGARIATDMLTAVDYTEAGGTAFLFIAGQVTGSTPYVTAAGSKLRISSTNSDLDITVAGSNVKTSKTGSGLKVEKTSEYHLN